MPFTDPVHEHLKRAREAHHLDLEALASRVGIREPILCAIEEGRFSDLPAGIYGRAAVRAYAAAVGLDPLDVLAACEPLLPPMSDPVAGLAYLRGVRKPAPPPSPESAAPVPPRASGTARVLAAAAVDALIVVATLLLTVAATALLMEPHGAALARPGATGFGLMGIALAATYFACVGGIAGATLGEQLTGAAAPVNGRVELRDVLARALRGATIDARALVAAGAWTAARLARAHARLQSSHSPSRG